MNDAATEICESLVWAFGGPDEHEVNSAIAKAFDAGIALQRQRSDDALEHAKREFYARGRRDLVLELLGELGYNENPERILEAVAAGEDFTEHPRLGLDKLARFYFQTVDEMKQVPQGAKGGH